MQASSSSYQHVLAGYNVATRAAMDPRNTRAEERDDLKSAVAPSASGIHANPSSSPPSGQDSLLNAKFALATTRALDNSKVDENDEEQGIPRKEAPDDASAAVENASDAASIRPGVAYHRHSKQEGRPRMDRDPEMCIDASESSDIPTSQRRSSTITEENIATARLVEEDRCTDWRNILAGIGSTSGASHTRAAARSRSSSQSRVVWTWCGVRRAPC
jgi:hypothetical protein